MSDNGYTPLEVALQKSLNTVPVRLLQEVTPQRSFDFLTGPLGLTSLVTSLETESGLRTDIDLAPLALGGLTKGVYCRDMAAAYQVFGNGGTYNKPYTFYRVTDSEGEELLKGGTQMTVQALDTDSAYVMNRLLQRVIRGPSGTGRGLQGSCRVTGACLPRLVPPATTRTCTLPAARRILWARAGSAMTTTSR